MKAKKSLPTLAQLLATVNLGDPLVREKLAQIDKIPYDSQLTVLAPLTEEQCRMIALRQQLVKERDAKLAEKDNADHTHAILHLSKQHTDADCREYQESKSALEKTIKIITLRIQALQHAIGATMLFDCCYDPKTDSVSNNIVVAQNNDGQLVFAREKEEDTSPLFDYLLSTIGKLFGISG